MTSPDAVATIVTVTQDLENALARRQRAQEEIKRLKSLVSGCDAEILQAINAEEDEFTRWVREVRGEVVDVEKRKIHWSDGRDQYVVYKRKGAERRVLDADWAKRRLLELGCPASEIGAHISVSEGNPGITVRKVVGSDDNDTE